jgi:hypothetical protein
VCTVAMERLHARPFKPEPVVITNETDQENIIHLNYLVGTLYFPFGNKLMFNESQ